MEMGKLIEVIGVKLVSYLFTSLIMYGIFRKTGEDKYKALKKKQEEEKKKNTRRYIK